MNRIFYLLSFLSLHSIATTAYAQVQEFNPDWLVVDGYEFPTRPLQRISSIFVRDPHFFVSPGFGCVDFTDNTILGQPNTSINGQINSSLSADANADNVLDASTLWLFPPTQAGAIQRVDTAAGTCSAPLATTRCDYPSSTQGSNFQVLDSGPQNCFVPIANTTGAYTPAVASLAPPCFVQAEVAQVNFDFNGISLPLFGVRIAGAAAASQPGGRLMLRGFLREADANTALIPATVPLIGGRPLSSLLPGGANNCSTRNDKDTYNGESGWWFYLEQTLSPVPTAP
jgi:hypothetical protein